MASNRDDLAKRVERQARRMKKAEEDRPNLMAESVYVGVLGLLFVLPVILGAYLGNWLDERMEGYSSGWTLSLICLGVVVGGINVWLYGRKD